MTGSEVEAALDAIRRQLAKAQTAQEILAAGQPIAALIDGLEDDMAKLSSEIAAEADNVDRSRTNALRAQFNRASDLMTDTENLARRIGERHEAALKAENDASMRALSASGFEKRSEIHALVLGIEANVRNVIDNFLRYKQLLKDIDGIQRQLRAANREDLIPPSPWRGIAQDGDDLSRLFDFLDPHAIPQHTGENFFKTVDRIRAASAAKSGAISLAGGVSNALRGIAKRAS